MKAAIAVLSTYLLGSFCALSQALLLNPGDSYVFNFGAMIFNGTYRISPAPTTLSLPNFAGTGILRLEAFENSLAEAPLFSTTSDTLANPVNLGDIAWHDLQGIVRVTELSGTLALDGFFTAQVTIPSVNSPPYNEVYFQSLPVPEPSSIVVATLFFAACALWKIRRQAAA